MRRTQAQGVLALEAQYQSERKPRVVGVIVRIPGAANKHVLWREEPNAKALLLKSNSLSVDVRVLPYVEYFKVSEVHFIDKATKSLYWCRTEDWLGDGYHQTVNVGEGLQWHLELNRWEHKPSGGYPKSWAPTENLDRPRFGPVLAAQRSWDMVVREAQSLVPAWVVDDYPEPRVVIGVDVAVGGGAAFTQVGLTEVEGEVIAEVQATWLD